MAAIVLGCSIGVAAAQNMEAAAAPPDPHQVLNELAQQHANGANAAAGALATVSKTNTGNLNANIPLGWNFGHATNCGWFSPGNGDQWFYIFPKEGGLIASINNLFTGQGLAVPCANGNWIAWHVINSTTGAYDQTYSYDFK